MERHGNESGGMMHTRRIGLDLAKNVFQAVLVEGQSKVVWSRRWRRGEVLRELGQLEPQLVVMEACGSAHYWAREIVGLGHQVWLLPAQHVRPYRQGQKNDQTDALAIVEASYRANLHPVPIKNEVQQELQAISQIRRRLIQSRTALVNQTRGILAEFGIVAPQGVAVLRKALPGLIERMRPVLAGLIQQQYDELIALDARIEGVTRSLEQLAASIPACQRLMKLRGIGPITAVALVAHCCPQAYPSGRIYSSVLGLVPRHTASGERVRLSRLTRAGRSELRMLLIHGGRSVVRTAHRHDDELSRWAREIAARRGQNKAAVAVANKLARYAWAELRRAA
jgi:transposase